MSRTLSILGVAITVVYLGILWFIFDGRMTEILLMRPNEIGDLLAGMFGPLAILWLILGFFQQGIELRQNTKALELQAEELKNSVEQQRELVNVTRSQMEAELAVVRHEQELQKKNALPLFVFHDAINVGGGPSHIIFNSGLENVGNTATNVSISCSPEIKSISLRNFATYKRGERNTIQWVVPAVSDVPLEAWMQIDFIDASGVQGKQRFLARIGENGQPTGEIIASA
jgi:hypothetical protein